MESHSNCHFLQTTVLVEKKAHHLLKLNYKIIIESLHVSIYQQSVVFTIYARVI